MNFFVVKYKDKYLCVDSRGTNFKSKDEYNFAPKLYTKKQYAKSAIKYFNNKDLIELVTVDVQGIL